MSALYPVLCLPLLGLALRCWGRCAARPFDRIAAAWFALGLALATWGVDCFLLLVRRTAQIPNGWAGPLALTLVGGALLAVFLRTWKRLGDSRGWCARKGPASVPSK